MAWNRTAANDTSDTAAKRMPTEGRYIRYSATSSPSGMRLDSTERVMKNHRMPTDASRSSGYFPGLPERTYRRTAATKSASNDRNERKTGISKRDPGTATS